MIGHLFRCHMGIRHGNTLKAGFRSSRLTLAIAVHGGSVCCQIMPALRKASAAGEVVLSGYRC